LEKNSIWKLPETFEVYDPSSPQKSLGSKNESTKTEDPSEGSGGEEEAGEVGETEVEEDALDEVKGFPNWRKVDRGDGMPYYFHVETQETSWELPTKN
jgi:hypothetical protein